MNYILHGSDSNRVHQKLSALKNHLKILESPVFYDAKTDALENIMAEIGSISIFGDLKMIVIDNSAFLSVGKDSSHYDLDALLECLTENKDNYVVMLCYADKLDTRKKIVKQLSSVCEVIGCVPLDHKSQNSFVRQRIQKYKLNMDEEAIKWFCARAGLDENRIDNELNKLSIYSKTITVEDLKNLMSIEPADDVFKMVDALFNQNPLRFLAYYRNFRQLNMEPLAIIALLASQIRFLFQVRVLMDEGEGKDSIVHSLKAHPYRVQINMKRASNFTSEFLLEQLSNLSLLDQKIKSGKIDKDEGIEQWILESIK